MYKQEATNNKCFRQSTLNKFNNLSKQVIISILYNTSFNSKQFILDIYGWKTKPETEPDRFRGPKPKNRGWEIILEPEPARLKTRGYLTRNRPVAILSTTCCACCCAYSSTHVPSTCACCCSCPAPAYPPSPTSLLLHVRMLLHARTCCYTCTSDRPHPLHFTRARGDRLCPRGPPLFALVSHAY
jgi:hypothetical protein